MQKLIEEVNRKGVPVGLTVEDWNAAVKHYFGKYFRRKSLLGRHRELLRNELVNLGRIASLPEYSSSLLWLLKLYRRVIKNDPQNSYNFLIRLFNNTVTADGNYMSLFMTRKRLHKDASLHDRTYESFDLLDGILEGSYKHHFRLMHGFATRSATGTFPIGAMPADFGALVSGIPPAITTNLPTLVKDPEHHIQVNQWRNIAAHKAFTLKTSRTVEIEYGRPIPHVKRLTPASVERVLIWASRALTTLRLSSVIIYIEYMPELKSAGLQVAPLRLESMLTGLCHNLGIVGFRCISTEERARTFTLAVQDRLSRSVADAIVHGSQALVEMSIALDADLTKRLKFDKVAIQLRDNKNITVAHASVDISAALAFSLRKMRMKRYVKHVTFVVLKK